ncbi:hypothetical protein HC931_24800 [Candidatus Gracilibacteria bacterium]|nr:hypothetical protein [Candidatus Gracilibacteria bacterium]
MTQTNSLAYNFPKQAPYLQYFSTPPLLSSDRAIWNHIDLEYHRQLSGEIPLCHAQQHVLCICTGGCQQRSQRWLGDCFHSDAGLKALMPQPTVKQQVRKQMDLR